MYEELKAVWEELTSPGQMFEVTTSEVRGAPMRHYALAPASLRDIWLGTAGYGDRDHLVYQEERCSFTQAHEFTASIANWLAAQGVQPGDRVAIAMRNYPEWMLAYWAITSMGAVVVGMNAWWLSHEMEFALSDSTPKVLICDRERLLRFEDIKANFPDMVVTAVRMETPVPDGVVDWVEVINSPSDLPEASIDTDNDACIFYTSGTTGKPKGARLTHRGCVNNLLNLAFINTAQPMALARATGNTPEPADPEAQMCALVATPLFHVTGNNCVAQAIALSGGKLVHMYKWDAAEALRLIEAERVTNFSAVPMMSRELLLHPDFHTRDTSSLKSIGGGGAALQPDLVHKLDQSLDNGKPSTGYGMTETCGIIAAVAAEYLVDKPSSCGPVMPTFEAQCVDQDGKALPTGEVGELWVRGAPVIKGYLNREEDTAKDITDGWLHTGDVAYLDEEGFLFLVDRAKDMVLRGGENVYCAEVENALFAHDDVAECVVFAVPDDRLGEEVGAAIYPVVGTQPDAATLRAHCKALVSAYKVPRYIWVVTEPLPRNANGKFVKREIRDALEISEAG